MTEKIITGQSGCVVDGLSWFAHRESYEPPDSDGVGGWPVGWGLTEEDAIADLKEQEEDQ